MGARAHSRRHEGRRIRRFRRKLRVVLQMPNFWESLRQFGSAMASMAAAAEGGAASLQEMAYALLQQGQQGRSGPPMDNHPRKGGQAARIDSGARGPEFTHGYVDEIRHWQGGRR